MFLFSRSQAARREECLEDVQCRVFERMPPAKTTPAFAIRGSTCCMTTTDRSAIQESGGSDGSSASTSGVDRNMIIVLAVLAIMFVGICVALHLFSKYVHSLCLPLHVQDVNANSVMYDWFKARTHSIGVCSPDTKISYGKATANDHDIVMMIPRID
ncbi:hypothetical protein CEXT_18541 [Caerostris extrusa]|uniref:Uncharacterized protein n=1 Tax=Caerostris extrusa TaxID=172846 RepID=A0AAV4REI0_CAEEX|nr:hypothetical protein CEXT_18541 [Caerostris extrusa]